MSRSKYWYQPLYWPPGGWSKREKSESSSSSCGPSRGPMNASAIFGQAASMIAAPGSSILPSRSRSRRLPPSAARRPAATSICGACALGRCRALEQALQQRHGVDRAHVLGRGGVHRRGHRGQRPLAVARSSGARGCSRAGRRGRPSRCGPSRRRRRRSRGRRCCSSWSSSRRADRCPAMCVLVGQEALPLVLAGALGRQAGIDARGRIGSMPLVYIGDVLVVDVERVERLRRLRRRLEEGLRVVDLAVREPAEEELVEDVLAVARALGRDRDPLPSTVA